MFGKSKDASAMTDTRTKIGTLIGEGAVFDGNLTAPETIRVDGTLNGNCTCEKEVIIGPAGFIDGNISAQSILISGKVNGDISVRGKLELLSTGKISGNVVAKSLVIDEDASFDGRCTMTTALPGEVSPDAGNGESKSSSETKAVEKEPEKPASDVPPRDFVRISANPAQASSDAEAETPADAAPTRQKSTRTAKAGAQQSPQQ